MDIEDIGIYDNDYFESLDLSSNDITDSLSTLFNETVQYILDTNKETESECSNSIVKNKKKCKRTKKRRLRFYICQCGKMYRSKENITLHYKNIHLKEKPYICNFCNCGFSHRNGKIYHERKFHTKIFPYHCPFNETCKCSFPTKSSLKYHMKSKHKDYTGNIL